jgi:ABC-type bacteriocin/lantibiotic exporter with double-glycine peptidase domain
MCIFDKSPMTTGARPATPVGPGLVDADYLSGRGDGESVEQPDQRVQKPRTTRTVLSDRGGQIRAIEGLYRYVWKISSRDQVILAVLSVTLFLLELAPLELQRRIINDAVDYRAFEMIGLLCLLYVAVALVQGGLKLMLNVYRGSVSEAASRRLRLDANLIAIARSQKGRKPEDEGVAISIAVTEVEAVGGFVAASFSAPILNGGVLLSVFGYMLFMQPWMALVALLLLCPQILFIPILQEAINRRTKRRIETLRGLSAGIIAETAAGAGVREETYRRRVGDVYRLNMEILRRKFGMHFLMNLLHHLGIIGILFVGGWLLLQGQTEMGTVVAFISGLNRMNDPWGDLVNYFRDLTNVGVKYQLIAEALGNHSAGPA